MMQEDEAARQRALENEQAAEARKQTLFADASAASSFLEQGDVGGVLDLMRDRYQILSQIPNVDTSHTKRYLDLAQSAAAGNQQAKAQLQTEMNNAVTAGRAYNQITGDASAPASFRSLQMQANAAGLKEGTPEYQEFMRYGGASGQMGAAKTITYNNGTVVKITRTGAPEVYGPNGQLVTDEGEKERVLTQARREGIAYEGDVATARARGTAEEGAAQEVLETGIRQAKNIGRLKDALRILDRVETGGLASIGLKAKRALGLTDADEARLAYILRKNVLQQLKPTFGAAFTAREGELLASIEANEDQSTAANRALLEDMIRQMELDIDRAELYAPDMGTGGQRAIRTMQGFMNQNFYTGDDGEGQGADPAAGQGVGSPEPAGGTTFVYDPVTKQLVPQRQ
jgi:hypothetical protein